MIIAYLLALLSLCIARKSSPIGLILLGQWAFNYALVEWNDGWPILPELIVTDFLSGVAMVIFGGRAARLPVACFIPMILLNATAYLQGPLPSWHWATLFGLAWAQVLAVIIGAWGDGLGTWLDSIRRGSGNRRALVSHNSRMETEASQ